jgi:hypothetical protein
MAKLNTKNYCVLETNRVQAVRTGEILAQYSLNTALKTAGLQQGMFVKVDHVAKEVSLAADDTSEVWLHSSEEQIYEEHLGREGFILKHPKLPRLYKPLNGDIIETDAVEMNSLTTATAVHATVGADGFLTMRASGYAGLAAAKVVYQVVGAVTLPNGKPGYKFTCIKGL